MDFLYPGKDFMYQRKRRSTEKGFLISANAVSIVTGDLSFATAALPYVTGQRTGAPVSARFARFSIEEEEKG